MAIEKTRFMLKYLKYGENLKNKKFEEEFKIGEEQRLIVTKAGKDFEKFAKNALKELDALLPQCAYE